MPESELGDRIAEDLFFTSADNQMILDEFTGEELSILSDVSIALLRERFELDLRLPKWLKEHRKMTIAFPIKILQDKEESEYFTSSEAAFGLNEETVNQNLREMVRWMAKAQMNLAFGEGEIQTGDQFFFAVHLQATIAWAEYVLEEIFENLSHSAILSLGVKND